MRGIVFVLFLSLLCTDIYGQQQQMYTQFMYNKLSMNPAYAGNEDYLSASVLYRDQWNGFPGAPTAQIFNVNLPRISKKVGIGINLEHQSIGITRKITYEMMYAYKFLIADGTLSMGMNISGRNYTQDYTDSRLFAIQDIKTDPSIPQTVQTKNLLNAGFGIYYNTHTFYMGASVPRMIKADIDFDKNNLFSTEVRHLFLMTGGTFTVNNEVRLTPQLLFRLAENTPFGIDLNGSVTLKNTYSLGLTYRTGGTQGDLGESIDLIFGFQMSEQLMLGAAYDIGLSKLRTASNGSLEVMLVYNFIPKKIKSVIINPRYF